MIVQPVVEPMEHYTALALILSIKLSQAPVTVIAISVFAGRGDDGRQINDHKLEDRSAQCLPIVSWLFMVTHSLLWQFAVFKCPYHVSLLPLPDEDEV